MTRRELIENIRRKGSFLCVGLDTDITKIPEHLRGCEDPVFEFNKAIVDATAKYAVAYKPNTAFYESMGLQGWKALEDTVVYIRRHYPDIFLIADAKRGDIGNTASMYARCFFEHFDFDAITLSPYMGEDSVTPFLAYGDKWSIVLALTSNRGSADFQTFEDSKGTPLYERVIRTSSQWGSPDNMMYVVGATRGSMIGEVRRLVPDNFLLVPGIGAQGGSLSEVARYGMNDDCGLLVNSSRGIIYASPNEDFATAAAREAENVANEMRQHLIAKGII